MKGGENNKCYFYYSRFFIVYFFLSLLLSVFTRAETDHKFIKQIAYPYFDEQLSIITRQEYLSQASWLLDFGIGHIVNKYPNVCIPAMFQNIEWYWNPSSKAQKLLVPGDFKKRLSMCFNENAEFILLPMTLFNEVTGAGHQTLLLFNNDIKTVEFYDPQGIYLQEDYFNSIALHETLNNMFDKMGLNYDIHNAFPSQWSENYKCSEG